MKSRPLPKGTVHEIDYSGKDKLTATMHFADGRDALVLKGRNHGDLQRQIQQAGHDYDMQKDPIGTVIRDIKTNIFGICC